MRRILCLRWDRYIKRLGVFLIVAALVTGMGGCFELPAKDLEIRTWHDLDAIRDNLSGHHRLMNDLDSTTSGYEELAGATANDGKGWQPIGALKLPFTGTFDGQGYEISDLFVAGGMYSGLFGRVGRGLIENVGVVNATVNGGWSAGGLVGDIWGGTVSNSYFTGNVTGTSHAGGLFGLVGWNQGVTVHNSFYNYDEVLINGENIITIGALSGEDFEGWLANDKFLDVSERLSEQDGYYLIHAVDDFRQLLAFGHDDSLKFRLQNDLDLGNDPNFYIPYFAAEFDGNSHKISNLSFTSDFVSCVGLFGYLAQGGKVTGLGVGDINVTGVRYVGGLVGFNWKGIVSDSHASGNVTGNERVGGLIGINLEGTVSDSHVSGSVEGDFRVGGLVGQNSGGAISDCHASASVYAAQVDSSVGGLVGANHFGTVTNSYASGSVVGVGGVGGLVGPNSGIVSNSYASGSVDGFSFVGGLVASNSRGATVSDSYASGNVAGDSNVGGLVGSNAGGVNNSYASGGVTGYQHVGGLVGHNHDGTVSNSFWDVETSEIGMSAGGTGKTTPEMMDIATFTDTETEGMDEPWDMIAVAMNESDPAYTWNIVDAETYPFLSWEPVY